MGRAPCCDKTGLKKGPWTLEEDQLLVDYIQKHGHSSWRTLPKNAGLERCGKSCRLRWTNYLRPDIKRGRFSFEEEETIIQLHSVLGNKWSAIAARLPGRTDNEIKNYWNTHIRKRLLRMGIDPVTHNRRFDLSDLSSLLTSQLHNSSEINYSTLLGIQPLINSELLKLATQNLLLQNLNDLGNSQFQDQTQIQPSLVEAFLNGTQPVQSLYNVDHRVPSNHVHCQEPQPSMWQGDILASSISNHVTSAPSYSYYDSSQSCIDHMLPGNSVFPSEETSDQKIDFDSLLSTPSTSLTPLNSCSTYTSTIEDERESFCSDILHYEIPDTFDMNAFM